MSEETTKSDAAAALEKKLEALNIKDEGTDVTPKQGDEKKKKKTRVSYKERVAQIEEEQNSKKVLETDVNGTVKWFSIRDRYGFIERADGGNDVFVHQTAIANSRSKKYYFRSLADGEKVVFDVVEGRKGSEAANVSGPDGTTVKGLRFDFLRFVLSRLRHFKSRRSDEHVQKLEAGDAKPVEAEEKPTVHSDGDKKPKKRFSKIRNFRKNRKAKEEAKLSSKTAKSEASEGDEKRGCRRDRKSSTASVTKDTEDAVTAEGEKTPLVAVPVNAQV